MNKGHDLILNAVVAGTSKLYAISEVGSTFRKQIKIQKTALPKQITRLLPHLRKEKVPNTSLRGIW